MASSINFSAPSEREHWLDISKFIAAVLIVGGHVPVMMFASLWREPAFNGRVAFFLIVAGYFMGRNCSWKKALERSVCLLIPFLIWNGLISLFYSSIAYMDMLQYLSTLVGYKSLFFPGFEPFGIHAPYGEPFSAPTWFLRDLILCSLLSPLFLKFKWAGILLILIAQATSLLSFDMFHRVTLAPYTVSLFCIGLYLSPVSLGKVKSLYKESYTPYVVFLTAAGLALGIVHYLHVCQGNPDWSMHQRLSSLGIFGVQWPEVQSYTLYGLFGVLLLMAFGIILEKRFPKTRRLSDYAPACFLLFVLHAPLIRLVPEKVWKVSLFAPVLLTPAIIVAIVCFYFLLRRWCPSLLPYLANERTGRGLDKGRGFLRRQIVILCCIVIVCIGVGSVARYAYRHEAAVTPIPYQEWQGKMLERHFSSKSAAGVFHEAPVVFLGDSLVEFWETDGREAWKKNLEPLGCLNLGTRCDATGNLLWRMEDGLLDQVSPRIVVVCVGVNNIGLRKNLPWSALQGNISIVKELRKRFSPRQTEIVLIPPLVAAPGSRLEALRKEMMEYDFGPGVRLLPLHDVLSRGEAGRYSRDGTHLTPQGYDAISPVAAEFLSSLLK